MKYINYKKYSVEYDESAYGFSCREEQAGRFLESGSFTLISCGNKEIRLSDYKEAAFEELDLEDGRKQIIRYSKGPEALTSMEIEFIIHKDFIQLLLYTCSFADVRIEGSLLWGSDPANSTYAVRLDGGGSALRTAHGPAASKMDHALYDRLTDSAMEIAGCDKVRLSFDWTRGCYGFTLNTGGGFVHAFKIKTHANYYKNKFSVPFKAINRKHPFTTPPVGWMTWYAVKFRASDKTVLENARWLSENLKEYGANCIWVDWEWCHSDFTGGEAPGVDIFNPNKERYPEGLEALSDNIRKLGLLPALWVGATNDTNKNRLLEENPEWVLANQPGWCGQWWIDPSHPDVAGKYIPAVFNQLLEWGYEAFKWDCLPLSLQIFDQYHDRFHRREISSEKALRNVVKAARDVIGDSRYMMSCSGNFTRDMMFGADFFDGARIGGDIFNWDEFMMNCIDRVFKYYIYHNVLWYADMDNLVLRSEFNNMEQARSRVSFYALAGVPVTLGDNLPELEQERLQLLKRAMPVVDIHPVDLCEQKRSTAYVLVNLSIEKPYGRWNVVDVMNASADEQDVSISLDRDLYLDTGAGEAYTVYDFWRDEFMGIRSESLAFALPPYGSKILSICKLTGHPQVISTSRHITQGAYDVEYVAWDEKKLVLSGKSRAVAGEAYKLVFHVPEGYELMDASAAGIGSVSTSRSKGNGVSKVTLMPDKSGIVQWIAEFGKGG